MYIKSVNCALVVDGHVVSHFNNKEFASDVAEMLNKLSEDRVKEELKRFEKNATMKDKLINATLDNHLMDFIGQNGYDMSKSDLIRLVKELAYLFDENKLEELADNINQYID